jgi:hypothetical protein
VDAASYYIASCRSWGCQTPSLAPSSDLQIQSFDQCLELGSAQGKRAGSTAMRHRKLTALESLAPDAIAVAVEVQTLQLRASAIDENEPMPAQRV